MTINSCPVSNFLTSKDYRPISKNDLEISLVSDGVSLQAIDELTHDDIDK